MNYIITKDKEFFKKIGDYNFCDIEELANLPEIIAFDSETTGLFSLVDDMFCCQIGTGENNYIIHMYDDNYTFYDVIPYVKDCTFVMQNGIFDLGFMYKYKFVPKKVFDTMLASRILYNGDIVNRRADFQAIMERELGVYYDKTDQKNIHIVKLSRPSAIKYSFNDVDRLIECHDVLLNKIKDRGFLLTYNLHCRFARALAYMEKCGLPLSGPKWLDKMKTDKKNTIKFQKEIYEYIYDRLPQFADRQIDLFQGLQKKLTVNLNSPEQMIPVFNALGIKTKDKDGKDSIDKKIIKKTKHEFVDLWLKYQEAQHRVSTFGKTVYDKMIDGRIYTNFNPMVDTARLSTRRGGINFLNFPSDEQTRDCFEAPQEHKMIVCDWSGQETVLAADLSGDEAMTKSVIEGLDLHCMMARVLYPELKDVSDENIIEFHSDKRQFSKAPRFAMQYGGSGYTLHINEDIPLEEAEDIFNKFVSLHPGLFEWGERNFLRAIKLGYIESVDGWKLKLPKFDWFSDLKVEIEAITKAQWTLYKIGKAERKRERLIEEANKKLAPGVEKKVYTVVNEEAYKFYKSKAKRISDYFKLRSEYKRLTLNNPIQTRGAHQMKLALSMIFEWIVEQDLLDIVLICNAVHDEVICEAPNNLAEKTKQIVGLFMKEAGDHYLSTLKIKADANIGQTWYEAK